MESGAERSCIILCVAPPVVFAYLLGSSYPSLPSNTCAMDAEFGSPGGFPTGLDEDEAFEPAQKLNPIHSRFGGSGVPVSHCNWEAEHCSCIANHAPAKCQLPALLFPLYSEHGSSASQLLVPD